MPKASAEYLREMHGLGTWGSPPPSYVHPFTETSSDYRRRVLERLSPSAPTPDEQHADAVAEVLRAELAALAANARLAELNAAPTAPPAPPVSTREAFRARLFSQVAEGGDTSTDGTS